jgi:hypothetical protein
MIFTSEIPSKHMTWKYVWGEVEELIREIDQLNWRGIRDEACDVYTCAMCAIARYTDIPMPIFWMRTTNTWTKRRAVWMEYFRQVGLDFHPRYVRYGSNYKKYEKRRRAIELAIKEQLGEKNDR